MDLPKVSKVLITKAQSEITIDWWYLGPQADFHVYEPIL